MNKNLLLIAVVSSIALSPLHAADQFFSGTGVALDSASYGATAAGPFTSAFVSGNVINFATVNGTGTGGTISAGGLTATENFTLSSPTGTFTLTGAANIASGMTVNLGTQVIAGSAINKTGAGTLIVSGNNTFSGTTTLTAGTLRATTNANALGASSLDFQGGSLELANDTGLNFARAVTVAGANGTITSDRLTAGAGVTQTLSSLTIGSRTLNIRAGSNVTSSTAGISISGATSFSGSTPTFNVSSGVRLTLNTVSSGNPAVARNLIANGAGEVVVTGAIATGIGGVTQSGTGLVTLSGNSTFTGAVTISSGTLRATTSANALGAGALALSGGTLQLANNTGLAFGRGTTVSGNTTIESDRTSAGAGVTHSLGTLSIGAQTLSITAGSNVSSGTAGVSFTGDTTLTGNAIFAPGTGALLTLGNVGGATRSLTVNGAGDAEITGVIGTTTGGLTKSNTGKLTLGGSSTFTGGTTLNDGMLVLGHATNTLADSGAVTINGGIFDLLGHTDTVGSVGMTGGTLTSSTSTGTLTGSGPLAKSGSGTATIAASATFSGGATVSAGTLLINGGVIGDSSVSAGTLGGSGSITGNLTVGDGSGSGDAILSAGNSPGTFTVTGSLAFGSDSSFKFELNSTTLAHDLVVANGVTIDGSALFEFVDLGGTAYSSPQSFLVIDNTSGFSIDGVFSNLANGSSFVANGNTYTANYFGGDGNDLVLQAVPEPATWTLLGVGLLAILLRRRSRRVQA